MISYAQNGEDVVLQRAFPAEHKGVYVDIGASDPVIDSVTKHFYEHGWSGVNVEPATLSMELLAADRPRDVNIAAGVGAEAGTLTFYELPRQMSGCSSFSRELSEQYAGQGWETTERSVEVITLAELFEEHVGSRVVDFLKIDVEGGEREVLLGADFTRWRPRTLVIEATSPGTQTPVWEEWESIVTDAGYAFALFDGINRFYVRAEDSQLIPALSAPANVLDDYVPFRTHELQLELERVRSVVQELERRQQPLADELNDSRSALRIARAQLGDARTELIAARKALSRVTQAAEAAQRADTE